jgi:RecB family exonuclease
VWSPFGAPALDALHELIEQSKAGDRLRSVTVIVPSGSVGLGVRRSLARGDGGSAGRGVLNVTFSTLDALAETVTGDRLVAGGGRPLTDAVLRAGIRVVLGAASWPGLGAAGEHPSTIEAIVATYKELRSVGPEGHAALAEANQRSAEMVRLLAAVRQHLTSWFDLVDVQEMATSVIEADPLEMGRRLGPVIVYLPAWPRSAALDLLRALGHTGAATLVLGATGETEADGAAHALISTLCPSGAPADLLTPAAAPAPPSVLSAPTADAELLLVLRQVMTRAAAGTPLERMAIVHSGTGPYPALVPALLRQAGIPCNGGATRPLASTVAGRVLLGALALPEQDWGRQALVDWLATGPLRHRGRPVPTTRWDRLSAEAGVTEGKGDWARRLAAYAAALRADDDGADKPGDDGRRWREEEARGCESLAAFVDGLATQLSTAPTSWAGWAQWARRLLGSLVGGRDALEHWPAEEGAAAEAVLAAIDQISVLDAVGAGWSASAARAALETELSAPAPQTTRFGAGVWVAPIGAAGGLLFDALFVVGLNEGTFPPHPVDDVLLPDRVRKEAASNEVPLRADSVVAMRRHFLAAVAGAVSVQLSYRRGSVRDGRELRPSRWALDAIATANGRAERLYQSQMADLPTSPLFTVTPSWTAALASPGQALDLADRDLRDLVAWTGAGGRLPEHPLCRSDATLGRAVDMVSGRQQGFTRYEGKVTPQAGLVPAVLSASGLERFAQCPRRYFFESVLHVTPRTVRAPEVATDGGALGSLIHRILEQYARPQIGRVPGSGPDDPFGAERVAAVAATEIAAFEAEGLAGPEAAWAVERTRLLRALRLYAEADREWRQREGVVTTAVEQEFGQDGSGTVAITVPGRAPVAFRGTIDRVDQRADGSAVVTDYKTGRADHFRHIEDDHFAGGRSVQLPLYAAAVGAARGQPVDSAYWCVSEREDFSRYGFTVDGAEVDALGQVVGVLTEAMASGQFPGNPGEEDTPSGACSFCPYQAVCPQDRFRAWQQVRQDPALSAYTGLAA